MKNPIFKLCLTFFSILFIFGCANQSFTVKPDLVSSFEPRGNPTDSETHVYVIRGAQFQGGGRSVLVGVNDSIHAALGNKSHTYLKLKSGINTISLVQGRNAFAYFSADFRPAETIFLYLDYEVGTLNEARPQLGKTMVQETKFKAPYEVAKDNSALNAISLNPGWLDLDYMIEGGELLSHGEDYAIITIGRPGVEFKQAILDFWVADRGLVGSLSGESFIQIKVPAGKHKFFAYLGELAIIELDVKNRQHYYLEARLKRGYSGATLELNPVAEKQEGSFPESWTTNLQHKMLNSEKINNPEIKERIKIGLSKFTEMMKNESPAK